MCIRDSYVDIHCVFPNWDADPDDPASYDFIPTDAYIQSILDTGCGVFYRLGASIEHGPKKYFIHPPADNLKWAKICAGIVRHYNHGWADGFHHGIRYWEIWNEPEGGAMWTGTRAQYFNLYATASKYLKAQFPEIMVGGYASCGFYAVTRPDADAFFQSFVPYAEQFLDFISAEQAPLDFFSWHLYSDNVQEFAAHADYVDALLARHGYALSLIHI